MKQPEYVRKKRKNKLKICQEQQCGKEFWGHPIAKYCEVHSDIKLRTRKKKVYEDVTIKNMVFEHHFNNITEVEFYCQLLGCNKKYALDIFPKQKVYPKYCKEHRNEFKRINFSRRAHS